MEYNISPHLPPTLEHLNCSGLLDSSLVSSPRTALVGYPGSGNSWVRILLEISTGASTCSDRSQKHLDGGCVLTLTHHLVRLARDSSRLDNLVHFSGRAVLLIRDPLGAVLSAYRHQMFGVHSGSEIRLRTNLLAALSTRERQHENIDQEHFARFALEQLDMWRNIIIDWVVLGTEVLVVHYEDFLEDKIGQLRKIIRFLGLTEDPRRLQCVQFASLEFYKRPPTNLRKKLFTDQLKSQFYKVVEEVNTILKKHGHRMVSRE